MKPTSTALLTLAHLRRPLGRRGDPESRVRASARIPHSLAANVYRNLALARVAGNVRMGPAPMGRGAEARAGRGLARARPAPATPSCARWARHAPTSPPGPPKKAFPTAPSKLGGSSFNTTRATPKPAPPSGSVAPAADGATLTTTASTQPTPRRHVWFSRIGRSC